MKIKKASATLLFLITFSSSGIFLSSCREDFREGTIIFTRVAATMHNKNYITGESWRYIPEAQIVAFNPGKSGNQVKVISTDYYSARSPEVSYDGRYLLFAAQKTENSPWQIWEMNLENLKVRQVTSSPENCIDPAYLPGGRIVFSKYTVNDTVKQVHSLYTGSLDGSGSGQITFNPDAYFAPGVLKDGRIVTISKQTFPGQSDSFFTVLRPDGTKAQMFCKGEEGNLLQSRVWETTDGRIVFTESEKDNPDKCNIISINYNRPLHSWINITGEIQGSFQTAFPMSSGKLLVTHRLPGSGRYELYEFDPENKVIGKAVYGDPGYDILEAVVVTKRERPRKLPSEVDMDVKTGLLLCQDINFTGTGNGAGNFSFPKSGKIEILGTDSILGAVNVEPDGSFYLKVVADTPFRIRTIDENGKILNGPCDWIYLRPNERRGCIGCHEDPELAPENRYCLSVSKPPAVIPVHKSEIKEKEIELE